MGRGRRRSSARGQPRRRRMPVGADRVQARASDCRSRQVRSAGSRRRRRASETDCRPDRTGARAGSLPRLSRGRQRGRRRRIGPRATTGFWSDRIDGTGRRPLFACVQGPRGHPAIVGFAAITREFSESIRLCNPSQHLLKYIVKRSRRCANQEDIMRARNTAFVGAVALLAVAAVSGESAPRPPLDRIVVFGASLSDSGNAFALRGGTNTAPDYQMDPLFVPAVPYARGGHHFTNGATWVEQYARSIGLAGSARPAFESAGRGTNYAVAAARGWEDGLNFNLSAQVDAFLQDAGGVAPSGALYTIEIGGNDIRDALLAYPAHGPILSQAIVSIRDNIGRLYAAGARNFL